MTDLTTALFPRAGTLMAIGGAEDRTRDRVILRRFLELAGGRSARLAVLATASELPDTGQRYADLFGQLGAAETAVLQIANRQEALAASGELLADLEQATGLFLTGGSQLRVAAALGGTLVAASIRRRHREGMVVGGTSAGASLLSSHMIAMGDSGATPRRRLVHLSPGLGLAPDLIIDQHFRRRDRFGRLLTALSYNPEPLGLGVDEDTAAIIEPEGRIEILGSGAVTVVNARGMSFTNSYAVNRGQPVAMIGIQVDVLTSGCHYDLHTRRGALALPEEALLAGRLEEPVETDE